MNVLVLGCDGNAGMNYAKCLRMAYGDMLKIYGTGFNKYHLTSLDESNLFDKVFHVPPMKPSNKKDAISNLCTDYDIDFVHAQPEEEVEFLCNFSLPAETYGKNEVERRFYKDKTQVQKLLGMNVKNYGECYYDDILSMLYDGDGKAWIRANNGAGSKYALPVISTDDAEAWFKYLYTNGKVFDRNDLSIGPYLPGREYAVQMLFINGEVIHAQQRERVEHFFARQMVSGQSSTPSVARTCNDYSIYHTAFDTIKDCSNHLDVTPSGIYCVDIREDIYGVPKVTEVNYGRYFTTSDFFARFGVNTPAEELLHVATGAEIEKKIGWIRDGIYWVRGLDHAPSWYTDEDLEDFNGSCSNSGS